MNEVELARVEEEHAKHEGGMHIVPGMAKRCRICFLIRELRAALQRDKRHKKAIGEFLTQLHATMIDPLAEGEIKIEELCRLLLEQARKDRETLSTLGAKNGEMGRLREVVEEVAENMAVACSPELRLMARSALLKGDRQ